MNETFRKFILYTRPTQTYWKPTKFLKSIVDTKIGFYPLSILPRIEQGHYPYMDDNGIPMFPNKNGELVHHYTTLCSYALGVWEKYLLTGDVKLKDQIIKTANFLVNNCTYIDDIALFLDYDYGKNSSGMPCAMNQGEAISVLIRAHELTNNKDFLQLAFAASKAYSFEYGAKGISKTLPQTKTIWFQEAGQFILNGHNYALWGIWELLTYTKEAYLSKLFKQGVSSLEKALPYFDCNYWSWYRLNPPLYIASMMYHNLHIVQLEHLSEQTNSEILMYYSRRFSQYAQRPVNRFKSALKLFGAKFI